MRKLLLIGFCVVIWFLCGSDRAAVQTTECTLATSEISEGDSVNDQLVCEREYNSNLNLPQLMSEVTTVRTMTYPPRIEPSFERYGIKCGVAQGRDGNSVQIISELNHNLYVGFCAVDHYVYRQHQLII